MSNEIITQQIMPPGMLAVGQTGKNNVNVTNQQGGIVNFNYNIQQGAVIGSAEEMMAVHRFSKQYYQLLVTCEESVFKDNIVTVSADRALCQRLVPPEIFERCSGLTEDGIKELQTFPALICRENTELRGVTDPEQMGMYAYIRRVMKVGRDIKVAFQPIAPFF